MGAGILDVRSDGGRISSCVLHEQRLQPGEAKLVHVRMPASLETLESSGENFVLCCACLSVMSDFFVTLWTVACQAPLHGILQARILEWVAMPFSRGSSQPSDQTQVSCVVGRFFAI